MRVGKLELRRATWLLLLALALTWAAVFWRNAWVCDDAYITFRSVEQLHAGNGPRWNAHARVQAFTHPLWYGLLSLTRAVSSSPWWNAVTLSFLLSTAALGLIASRLVRKELALLLLVAAAISSKAFVDYSSSGLENPLVFALLAVFLALLSRLVGFGSEVEQDPEPDPRGLTLLILVGSLILLCRHDLLLVVAPPIAALAWRFRSSGLKKLALAFLVGTSPFLAWTAFSTFYYGFPFPNTAYAKLNTGVGAAQLWRQGLWYFSNALRWDPLTFIVCLAGPLVLLRSRYLELAALGFGCYFHLLYIAKVGGDFMAGRFLTPVFFLGLATLSVASLRWRRERLLAAVLALGLLNLVLPGARLFVQTSEGLVSYLSIDSQEHGIADEKRVWTGRGSFRGVDRQLQGMEWRASGAKASAAGIPVVHTAVGWDGFNAGVDARIVDVYALADPLLARLPAARPWRIGHFSREIPVGYTESLATGENRILNPEIHALYERIRRVTEGPLLSWERLKSIVYLNLIYRRPVCIAPPCRNLRTRLLEMDIREPLFPTANGEVETLTVVGADESEDGLTRLVITGWVEDEEADLILLADVPIKKAKIQNAWHQSIGERSGGKIGPLAGFQLTAEFKDSQRAARAAETGCLAARLKPRGKPQDWRLIPRVDGRCQELLLSP